MPNRDLRFKETFKQYLSFHSGESNILLALGQQAFLNPHTRAVAVVCFTSAMEQAPEHIDIKFWLGLCSYYFEGFTKAFQVLSEALLLNPYRADCLSLIAYICREKGDLNESLAYLRRAIQISPDWPMLWIEMIDLLIELDLYQLAQEAITDARQRLNEPALAPYDTKDEVVLFYENVITGRAWTDFEERLNQLHQFLIQVQSPSKAKGLYRFLMERLGNA